MFIKQQIYKEKIIVSIPLTKGTEKIRIKTRPMLNDYGVPVSTRSEPLTNSCYVEWQIGYDVVATETDKLQLTTLPNLRFIGANTKTKALYELSEYIKIFYDWGIISKKKLLEIKLYLEELKSTDFIDKNEELKILRKQFENRKINGFDFLFTHIMYPLLVCKLGNFEIVSEVIIKEKQYARGTQPMLYLCFPVTELDNGNKLLGRSVDAKECAEFTINKNNIFVFLELLKMFGTLSSSHNYDIIKIIDLILK